MVERLGMHTGFDTQAFSNTMLWAGQGDRGWGVATTGLPMKPTWSARC